MSTVLGVGAAATLAACGAKGDGTLPMPTVAPASGSGTPPPPAKATPLVPSMTPTLPPGTPIVAGLVNVLVIGSDTRDEASLNSGNSDVLVLVQLTPKRDHINMISFARDSAVTLPGGGQGKINSIYPGYGAAATRATVESMLGINVHYVLETSFQRFQKLTNLLGGVTVHNLVWSNSLGYTYAQGDITLAGQEAEYYVRERKSLPNGDLDRTERHRAFLTGFMSRLKALALKDERALRKVIPNLFSCLRVTGSFTPDHAIGLIPVVKKLSRADVTSVLYPVTGFGWIGTASVDILNAGRGAELAAAAQSGNLAGYVARYGTSSATTG